MQCVIDEGRLPILSPYGLAPGVDECDSEREEREAKKPAIMMNYSS